MKNELLDICLTVLLHCIAEDLMDGLQPFSTYDSYFCEQCRPWCFDCRDLHLTHSRLMWPWLILPYFVFSFQNLGWDSGRYSSVCVVCFCHACDVTQMLFFSLRHLVLLFFTLFCQDKYLFMGKICALNIRCDCQFIIKNKPLTDQHFSCVSSCKSLVYCVVRS